MRSSSQATNNDNNNNSNGVISCSSSTSRSSSSWSSPSKFSPSSPIPTTTSTKSMGEVWKDINLASLNDVHPTTTTITTTSAAGHSSFGGMMFQDFMSTPLNDDASRKTGVTGQHGSLFGTPATLLSLNSGPDCDYLESNGTDPPSHFSSLNSPFDGCLASSLVFPSFCKKRDEPDQNNNENSTDRRHKRMMKNRESAARSRARRQAYTTELELEVANLKEENAKLRRQQEKLFLAAPAQLPQKRNLYRTLTAPF